MECPECNSGNILLIQSEITEPNGERYAEEFWQCVGCGFKSDESDEAVDFASAEPLTGPQIPVWFIDDDDSTVESFARDF